MQIVNGFLARKLSKLRRSWTAGFSLAIALSLLPAAAEPNRAAAISTQDAKLVSRLVIKLRQPNASANALHLNALSQRLGVGVKPERNSALGTTILRLERPISLRQAQAASAQISADSAIDYLVAEQHLRAFDTGTIPNDTLYNSEQWNLFAPTQTININNQVLLPVGGSNLPGAWLLNTGNSTVRVAVVDSGILPSHPDLASNLIPGYDFVSADALTSFGLPSGFVANDNDGRDADPADPGDWVSAAEQNQYTACQLDSQASDSPSSWHGSHIAGTIAAASNNAQGIAGMAWNVRLMPLRVLGKCGGSSFDIVDAMLWAAGIEVPGVPNNPNPVDVINLSLGGSAMPCDRFYQDAIDKILAKGVSIVAASGNGVGAVVSPANCRGVIAVTGHTIEGDNASFANIGPEIVISAPAGGIPTRLLNEAAKAGMTAPENTAPGRSILSTGNFGLTTVGAYGYTAKTGTSMAAPHVAGVVALLRSIKPTASPAEILSLLKASARPHPADGYCIQFAKSCGAGLLDAEAALRLLSSGSLPNAVSGSNQVVALGSTVELNGSASSGSNGITGYAWRQINGPIPIALQTANTSIARFTANALGDFYFDLQVTDAAGIQANNSVKITVVMPPPVATTQSPATPVAVTNSGGGGGSFGGLDVLLGLLLGFALFFRRKSLKSP